MCMTLDLVTLGPTVSAQLKAHLITLCTLKWRWGKNPEQLLPAHLATGHAVDTLDGRSFTFSSFFFPPVSFPLAASSCCICHMFFIMLLYSWSAAQVSRLEWHEYQSETDFVSLFFQRFAKKHLYHSAISLFKFTIVDELEIPWLSCLH